MVETAAIIRHALRGDKESVKAYAKLLAENLLKEGKERQHRMIMRALEPDNELYQSAPVVLDAN